MDLPLGNDMSAQAALGIAHSFAGQRPVHVYDPRVQPLAHITSFGTRRPIKSLEGSWGVQFDSELAIPG